MVITTLLYKIWPFKEWFNEKPRFSIFPKYRAHFDKPVSEIETALEKLQFTKTQNGHYIRGKIYGDFSAKVIKLTVIIEDKEIKVYASFFGVLFDTGDLWQVTHDILKGV